MAAIASVSRNTVAAKAGVRRASPVVRGAVKVQARLTPAQVAKKAAGVAVSLPALIAANPAFALVDDRLNGDGTGLPLGVNDPALGWVIFGVFATVWTIWFNAQKDISFDQDFEDDEAGLGL